MRILLLLVSANTLSVALPVSRLSWRRVCKQIRHEDDRKNNMGKEKRTKKRERSGVSDTSSDPKQPLAEDKPQDVPVELEPVQTEPENREPDPPKEPEPEPIYEEPVLTKLIVESYEGEKMKGMYHGQGKTNFKGGHSYIGEFSDGMMHGQGKYTWADGIVYEGEFQFNRVTGRGQYNWPDGCSYDGDVLNGLRHGHGLFTWLNKPVSYTGQWVHGKREGHGVMNYASDKSSFYEGMWKDNSRHGYGIRRFRSGNVYEGQWSNNRKHGVGTMRWLSRDETYTGEWLNDIQHGHGEHTWYLKRIPGSQYPLRNQYIGQWCSGYRQGQGTFYYADGSKYDGEWNANQKHGKGVFMFKNGRLFEGIFNHDHMVEYPEFTVDGVNTPDISNIRTKTPLGYYKDSDNNLPTEPSSTEKNCPSPSISLNIDHILENFPESERGMESKQVQHVVLRHVTHLRRVYNFYSCVGHEVTPDNTFIMTRLQFWRFIKDAQLHLHEISLAEIDRLLAQRLETSSPHLPNQKLLLREFISYLITLSYHLYKDDFTVGHTQHVLASCLSQLLSNHVIPNDCVVKGHFLVETRRASIAMGYIDKCWEIYISLCTPGKQDPHEDILTMRDFLLTLKDFSLINERLTTKNILEILSADDSSVYDGEDCNLELEMTFLEFFEALLGCAVVYVTESLIQDPNSPRPSTAASQGQTTTGGTGGRASQLSPSRGSVNVDGDDDGEKSNDNNNLHVDTPTADPTSPKTTRRSPGIEVSQKSSTRETNRPDKQTTHRSGGSQGSVEADSVSVTKTGDVKTESRLSTTNVAVVNKTSEDDEVMVGLAHSAMSGRSVQTEDDELPSNQSDDIDEEQRQFNFWTHQLHIFFVRKFFPAAEHLQQVKQEIVKIREVRLAQEEVERLKRLEKEKELLIEQETAELIEEDTNPQENPLVLDIPVEAY